MSKINLDEDETLSEPIEIVIEGKTFKVVKITDKLFKKVTGIGSLAEQFALLTNSKKSQVENLNLIKISKALRHIMQMIIGTATGMNFEQLLTLTNPKKEDKETEAKND